MTVKNLSERLYGVIPPIVTPLDAHRRFDSASGLRLGEFMVAAGVNGLFVLGTSGECPYLDHATQVAAVKSAVVSGEAGRVPVLAGVLAPGTDVCCELAKEFEGLGADAIVVAPPYYYPATQEQIRDHFRAIKDAVKLPVMGYDIPVTTHHRMSLETVLVLANEGTIIGLKDSTGDYGTFRRLLLKAPPTFRILTGSEPFFDSVLDSGAHGVVPGLANVAPRGFVQLYQAFQAGDRVLMSAIQQRLTELMEVFFKPEGTVEIGRAIGAMKAALFSQGILATTVTSRPFPQVTDEMIDRVRRFLEQSGF